MESEISKLEPGLLRTEPLPYCFWVTHGVVLSVMHGARAKSLVVCVLTPLWCAAAMARVT